MGTGEDGFSYTDIKDHVVKVTEGGSERGATWVGRLNAPNNDRWKIRVEPETYGNITVEIVETTDCSADGAVCKEGRMLSPGISAVVRGPIAMSVADAEATEETDANMEFVVTLSGTRTKRSRWTTKRRTGRRPRRGTTPRGAAL